MSKVEAVVKKSFKNGRYYAAVSFQGDVFTMSSKDEAGIDLFIYGFVSGVREGARSFSDEVTFVTRGLDLRKLMCPLCDHSDPQCDVCEFIIRKED